MKLFFATPVLMAVLSTAAVASAPDAVPSAQAITSVVVAGSTGAAPVILEARRGRGADDGAGHTRRGRGTDDAPNHG